MYKIIAFQVIFVLLAVYSIAQPSDYYDNATGTGFILKSQLHDIIAGHNQQSYKALWNHFKTIEVDKYYENDGSPLDMYSENPNGNDPYNFSWGTDQCGQYTAEASCYNREHSFPKSWFNDAKPMYTDLFHLILTDGYVNSKRSNYPFGEVENASWTSQNGSKLGNCSYPGYSGTVFEPIDEFKGDFARIYFYMATRYEDVLHSWHSTVLDGSTDQVYVDWYLNMMLEWHKNDPVSQKEIDRNNGIYAIQGNRNPFVDNPQWVYSIWGGEPETNEPTNYPSDLEAFALDFAKVKLTWKDATGEYLPIGYLILANTTGSFNAPVDGNDPSLDNDLNDGSAVVKVSYGQQSAIFSHLNSETTYYFKIWSYTNSGTAIDFKTDGNAPEASAKTLTAPSYLLFDNFESDLKKWTVVDDQNPRAGVVITDLWDGAESTSHSAIFDAPNSSEITHFISSIEKTFHNVYDLSLDLWYYFEDYRGGEVRVLLNNQVRYMIYTEGQGDLQITENMTDKWHQLNLDLKEFTKQKGDYTLKIRGEAKCSNSWTDRVAIDQVKVYGEQGVGIAVHNNRLSNVYPNPVHSELNIKASGIFQVKITDINGCILVCYIASDNITIPIHKLGKGFYIVSVFGDGYVENHKVVVN